MAHEQQPEVFVQNDAFAPEQLPRLLPLIRIVRRRVIALYADAFLVGHLKPSIHITEEMCAQDGRPQLLAALLDPREISFSEIRTVQAIAPLSPFEKSGCRFQVETATQSIPFQLSGSGAVNLLLALEQLLPGRVSRRISIWQRLNWRTLGVIALIASGLVAIATFILPSSTDVTLGLVGVFSMTVFIP